MVFYFNFSQKSLILDLTISRFSRLIFPWEISRQQISRFPVSREKLQCLITIYLHISWNNCSALTPSIIVPVPRITKRNTKYNWMITWKNDSPWLCKECSFTEKKSRSLFILVISSISLLFVVGTKAMVLDFDNLDNAAFR